MMKKENEKSEDFNEIMELKEELDTDIKNLEKDLNYYRQHKAEMKENGELDEETKRTIEMLEEVLNFIKSVVSMVDEIMKTTEIIEEYDEDEFLENAEFFEEFENTLDI